MAGTTTTTEQDPQGDPAQQPAGAAATGAQSSTAQVDGDGDQGTTAADELQAELERTREALKKANKEAAERRRRLQELEDAQKAKEREGMDDVARLTAELDDLKKTAAERDTLAQEAEALRSAVQAQVDALIKELNVPKYVAPLMEAMSPAQKLAYLTENRVHFARPTATPPNIDAAQRGGGPAETEEQQEARLKKRYPSLGR